MAERSRAEVLGEGALWSTRLLLLLAVAGSVVTSAALLWMTTVDLVVLVGDVADYTMAGDRSDARSEVVATVVMIIDGYLIAAILIVVAFGLYELFINRLDPARSGAPEERLLTVGSLDDLKERVAKLVVLVLVIEFFQRSLRVSLDDARDLALLAGGIALVSLALVLPALTERRLRHDQRGTDAALPIAGRECS